MKLHVVRNRRISDVMILRIRKKSHSIEINNGDTTFAN